VEKNGYSIDSLLDAVMIEDPAKVMDFAGEVAGDKTGGAADENTVGNEIPEPLPEDKPLSELIDSGENAPSYQKLYPDLYTDPPTEFTITQNAAYLTFDDGPSEHTDDILYILDSYDIKATFFFSGGDSEED
jgi:hypothetical protein